MSSKYQPEKPIGYRRNGIAIYKSSPRQAAIAKSLARSAQLTDEAIEHDAGGTGTVNGR